MPTLQPLENSGYLELEFHKQIQNLISKNYHKHLKITEEDFIGKLEALRVHLKDISLNPNDIEKGYLQFVIVIKNEFIPTETAMSEISFNGRSGVVKLFPRRPEDFHPITEEVIPLGMAYIVLGIDRGSETINIPPAEALRSIRSKNRIPLTLDEGIAILTHYPEFLSKNNCFSLLASRHESDKRVPAIWINKQKELNLGWCWDGNPHTWLGSASALARKGAL